MVTALKGGGDGEEEKGKRENPGWDGSQTETLSGWDIESRIRGRMATYGWHLKVLQDCRA